MSFPEEIGIIIPAHVKLIVVSKTQSPEKIKKVYDKGIRIFGENKVQELISKFPLLPNDIQWHFIGHLQTNKVKFIAPFISFIHSVDSHKLLQEINKEAKKNSRVIECLIEIHIAKEESKFGVRPENIEEFLNPELLKSYSNVRIAGLMGMATYTENKEQVRKEFRKLKFLFDEVKSKLPSDQQIYFKEISMGMSSDYEIAIEEGATMVRIGTAIFGMR